MMPLKFVQSNRHFAVVVASLVMACFATASDDAFRPPAVPLIACDPYFSVWSQADKLWEVPTTHWTGARHRMAAIVRVDGTAYRLMGESPQTIAAMQQRSVRVNPTQTIYEFETKSIEVTLTFTTPSLPYDLSIISRPTTYLDCNVASRDGKPHSIEFYFDARGELASDVGDQLVSGSLPKIDGLKTLEVGTDTQLILGRSGDDIRIDWGYLYVSAFDHFQTVASFGDADTLRQQFANDGVIRTDEAADRFPAKAGDVAAAITMSLGKTSEQPVSCTTLIAYDDLYSIEFMKSRLRPYWRKDGWEARDSISAAMNEHDELIEQCQSFDQELMADLTAAGGRKYAEIAALAYRQCLAAGKFVADENGQPLQFCKENHSNGCIATSDVFYPMMPQFLLFGPTLTKSVLVPFMEYAASDRWKFPYAPHDLGTYPKANGQRYGGGERTEDGQMPVEESGNLLILFGALTQMENSTEFAENYWTQLKQWANYLEEKGFDPENQLCTDDFAGHMAHNVNLSAKAICGLGAYALMCEKRGLHSESAHFLNVARNYAKQWMQAARDGDHYRLAFDREGTWSQKYNLVWDRLLGLGLFPSSVAETEMAFYRKTQNKFGLPLDNRSDYTKLDWVLWTATLTQDRSDFDALVEPVHEFLSSTPQRTPMTDWYYTSTAKKVGFDARPVVGGVFLQLLYNDKVWSKYASRDQTKSSGWAPMPVAPERIVLVPTSENSAPTYSYTLVEPSNAWFEADFDDSSWRQGPGGFGNQDGVVRTRWNTANIWVRRDIEIVGEVPQRIAIRIWHDEDAKMYINGKLVLSLGGFTTGYETFEIDPNVLRSGINTVAISCRQSTGGQYIDFGIDKLEPKAPEQSDLTSNSP
ncbi:glutaminase family protein [Neorhodopirellula pilleata]|uniref:Glutaminase A n=1 Tax=Neorhodopirellula pilleata TaxID=2714738 RepID=A0A5C6A0Z0_9BACT|nr:glutaminase family protein [Neorhodopirellula pilleata]TWT92213.1 hypothetical protein Pla100_47500 [Neorhodopirellula pilleata]